MPTTTTLLYQMSKDLLPASFKGVFARDELPKRMLRHQMFILNTDTSNLQGTHWVAVIVRHGEGYYFDSLGFTPPLMVIHWLNKYCNKWTCNTRQIQTNFSQTCGYFCIQFLYYASVLMQDTAFKDIVNVLYPIDYSLLEHERNVIDFSKQYVTL